MSTSYTFERCLGRGGFGEVYLATRRAADGLERRVAVKVLREDLPNLDAAVARLQDEGRLLAMLDHPAIVQVVELTRLAGRVALVTEYVDGVDLSRFAGRDGLLPPRVVAEVMGEVAGALSTAAVTPSPETGKPLHLIHRDVKPENIRISRHGEAKLLDFGIARSEEVGRHARTTTGNVPFTAGYTAPETFVSLLQHPPSDVFAWGATTYRLLTGERFYGDLKLTDQAALSGSPERWAEWLASRLDALPEAVRAAAPLLAATLAHDPAERPPIGVVQERIESLASALPGLSLKRWAREARFPEAPALPGALVGAVLAETKPGDSLVFASPVRRPPPPPPAPKGLHLSPPTRESSTDRPLPPPPPARSGGSWWVRLGAGLVVLLLAVAAGLLGLAALFSGIWMMG